MWYQKADNLHVSRHTCATLLVHQGVAITTVQKTARTYFRKDHTDLFGGTFQHHCA